MNEEVFQAVSRPPEDPVAGESDRHARNAEGWSRVSGSEIREFGFLEEGDVGGGGQEFSKNVITFL